MAAALLLCAALISQAEPARGEETQAGGGMEVRTETILYKHGDTVLEGYLAAPASAGTGDTRAEGAGKGLPGILVIHDWSGVGPYVRERAEQLAGEGYVAMAIDIYGQGNRPESMEERARTAGSFRSDRELMRARARAGLERLKADPRVDGDRIAAIGYCFGGGAALEMARSGAPLAGVVSFHGSLDTPRPADMKAFRGKILVCHGADDPHVPPEQVAAFLKEVKEAGVDYQFIMYGGAVHSFTQRAAGGDPSKGSAYHEGADRRSWRAMMDFLAEIFG